MVPLKGALPGLPHRPSRESAGCRNRALATSKHSVPLSRSEPAYWGTPERRYRHSSARFLVTSFTAIEDRSPCENEPAQNGHAGEDRGDRVTKQYGGPDGTPERSEIRRNVVDGGDESPVDDMGASYEDTTREGRGQEETNHDRSLAETPSYPAIGSPLIACPGCVPVGDAQ